MSRRIDLLRLDYLFSVLTPCLIAIFIHDLNIIDHLDILIGFSFFAITGNTLNDIFDMRDPNEIDTLKRTEGYPPKHIFGISVTAFTFGCMMFMRTVQEHPENGLFLVLIVVMVVGYCIKKDIPIFNQFLLGISHIMFPYMMIKANAGIGWQFDSTDWILMLCFLVFAATGQFVHEAIDGDSITRLSLEKQRLVILSMSVLTILMGIWVVFFSPLVPEKRLYFAPFIVLSLGTIYTFRHPRKPPQSVKDLGLITGNIIMVYLIVLILQNTL